MGVFSCGGAHAIEVSMVAGGPVEIHGVEVLVLIAGAAGVGILGAAAVLVSVTAGISGAVRAVG